MYMRVFCCFFFFAGYLESSWSDCCMNIGFALLCDSFSVYALLYYGETIGSLLLVIRGVPKLILAQSQVLDPLNSQPVTGYSRGGATPIWSPAQSGGYMYIQCIARRLTPGITRGVTWGCTLVDYTVL